MPINLQRQLRRQTPQPGITPISARKNILQNEEQVSEALANFLYGTGGEYGPTVTAEGLGPYMAKDPLWNTYDLANNMNLIKSFAQDPQLLDTDIHEKMDLLQEKAGAFGYTRPYTSALGHSADEVYIRDLNKFVNQPDVLNPNTMGNIYEQNKRIGDVVSHELRHQLMQEPKFRSIREERNDLLYPAGVESPEEVFNRFLDLKSNQLRGQLETKIDPETGEQVVDYRNLKGDYRDYGYLDYKLRNTENIPMMGSAFAWQQKLDPLANKFFNLAQYPSPYPWTGYTAPKRPIGGGYTIPKRPIGGGYTMPKRLTFKQQQSMNQRKQIMQEKIRQAEAAKKITTAGGPPGGGDPGMTYTAPSAVTTAKGPPSIISRTAPISVPVPAHISGGGGGGGQPGSMPTGTAGKNPWGRADGGLINFYRYGGFVG